MMSAPHGPDTSAAEWRGVSVRYPFASKRAVGPIDLRLERGERVLLLGASGSGKSTLLLTLSGLVPDRIPADRSGVITVAGEDVRNRTVAGWAANIAHYFQDAEQTLCGFRVEDEISFALENQALPEAEISDRVTTVMRAVELPHAWRQRRTTTLSGGEKQLVALAATIIQGAALFMVDEPTAHLAPLAARRMHRLLASSGPEQCVLIVDHRLDGLIDAIDRLIVIGPAGGIIADGVPRTIFRERHKEMTDLGIWTPASASLDAALVAMGLQSPQAPLSVAAALAHLNPAHMLESERVKVQGAIESFLIARTPSQAFDFAVKGNVRGTAECRMCPIWFCAGSAQRRP